MLLKKFIEQHGVYLLVTHAVGFAFFVAHYEVRIHLRHFFGHEPELGDALGVDLLLVAEGDRLEREDRLACLVHWLDLIFKSRRGCGRAELAVSIHINRSSPRSGLTTDAGDIG